MATTASELFVDRGEESRKTIGLKIGCSILQEAGERASPFDVLARARENVRGGSVGGGSETPEGSDGNGSSSH